MANLFNTIYTGTLAQYLSATKDANALYMIHDGETNVKSMYRGETKVAGDFIIVYGAEPTTPEEGVIYYVSEFGKKEAAEGQEAVAGKPYVGFWDGENWVALSDSATIDSLDERIEALEDSVNGTGEGEEHVPGLLDNVATLMGADTVEGSVKKTVKDAIDALDYEDEETEGDVVVAVSQENGVIAVEKQTLAVTEQETPSKDMQKTYDVTIGTKSVGKIDIPFCDAVLENAVLGKMDSEVDEETGDVTTPEGSTAHDALVMVFKKGDGTYVGVKVDIATILTEAEFKDGLVVSENGEVSVKLVADNDYLKFGTPEAAGKNAPLVANVVTLANAKAGEGETAAVTGLADALDVKTTIEENEKVTAAALNDLNTRVGEGPLKTTAQAALPAINELKDALEDKNVDAEGDTYVSASATDNKVTVAATASTKASLGKADTAVQTITVATANQEVTVSDKDANNGYTIGVTKATYTAAAFEEDGSVKTDGVLSQGGLVDSAVLKAYIADEIAKNAIYWKEL